MFEKSAPSVKPSDAFNSRKVAPSNSTSAKLSSNKSLAKENKSEFNALDSEIKDKWLLFD